MKMNYHRLLAIMLFFVSGFGYLVSCTHDNEPAPPPVNNNPVITRGTNVHLPGAMTAGNPNEWKFDKAHSSVLWATNYVGASGLLTGRFNQFGVHNVTDAEMLNYTTTGQPLKDTSWAFYENEPSKSYFSGYVQTNTSNTGEPGRDAGCNLTNLGTTAIVPGVQNLTVTNIARIKTTAIEFDPASADYLVRFNFTWKGGTTGEPVTRALTGRLKYITKANIAAAVPYSVFGLQFIFQFNCRDFGITSQSVSDKIDMTVNINFHNK
jgi:polyisoprenoid-binding protein YceI